MPRATDIMPITQFTRAYQSALKRLRKHGRPQVLTVDGKPAVIVQDAAAYDELLDQLYIATELARGLADDRPPVSVQAARARIARLAKAGWKKPVSRTAAKRAA